MRRVASRRSVSLRDLQHEVDTFNGKCPVGGKVTVRRDDGTGTITTTRSEAYILSSHTAVIQLDGIRGCYLLERVTPIVEAKVA